jgi:hypothetical protein
MSGVITNQVKSAPSDDYDHINANVTCDVVGPWISGSGVLRFIEDHNQITLVVPQKTALTTIATTQIVFSGFSDHFHPTFTYNNPCMVLNDNVIEIGQIEISNGTITIRRLPPANYTGICGVLRQCIVYQRE